MSALSGMSIKLTMAECDEVKDVSALRNVHTWDISECLNDETHLDTDGVVRRYERTGGSGVSVVSALGNTHTLNLTRLDITDISMLGNVHTLILNAAATADVSMLGNVHTLDLSDCPLVQLYN